MAVEIIIVLFTILIIFWVWIEISNESTSEGFRLQARAYQSCAPLDCGSKRVHPSQLLRINPFIWPYSATMYMQEFNVSKDIDSAHITPYHSELMQYLSKGEQPSA